VLVDVCCIARLERRLGTVLEARAGEGIVPKATPTGRERSPPLAIEVALGIV